MDRQASGGLGRKKLAKEGAENPGMSKPHRIAAGGIIFKGHKVLLVRYRERDDSGTFVVGPGGGLTDEEDFLQAIVRETKEETGITVEPKRIVAIENLLCTRFKMVKVWMACEFISGEIHRTKEAEQEGILEADWFTKEQLEHEVVYPAVLMKHDWEQFQRDAWRVECLPLREANI
jgi:8-oxo-dGTP pyrophosphatase MutT (NUDIX family)